MGIDADGQLGEAVAGPLAGQPVLLDKGVEPLWHASDDRDRHRKPKSPGSRSRLRRSSDADPDRQWILHWPGVNTQVLDGGTMFPRPQDNLRPTDFEQQIKVLREELVVFV